MSGTQLTRGQKVRNLVEGENFNQNLANKYFVPTDHWKQVVQPSIYETKNGNVGSLCLPSLVMGEQVECPLALSKS